MNWHRFADEMPPDVAGTVVLVWDGVDAFNLIERHPTLSRWGILGWTTAAALGRPQDSFSHWALVTRPEPFTAAPRGAAFPVPSEALAEGGQMEYKT